MIRRLKVRKSDYVPKMLWAVTIAVIGAGTLIAQEISRETTAAGTVAEPTMRLQPMPTETGDVTIKSGDFRLLISSVLGAEWNDNVNTSKNDPESDFILRPMANFDASYPITAKNLLQVRVGIGYEHYFDHSDLCGLTLRSGSEVSFDVYIKSVRLNLHDRISYTKDSASNAGVAGASGYGGLDNTAGLSAEWGLKDVVMMLGYDHHDFVAAYDDFSYSDRATEMVTARTGYRFHPNLTAGLEGAVSFTTYRKPVMNDGISYSGGVFADYQPSSSFKVQPGFGYTIFTFQQTSRYIEAEDQDAWYLNITLTHSITEAISYSVSGGHELTLGTQSDTMEDWYFRPSVSWSVMKNVGLTTFGFYQHGRQGTGMATAGVQNVGVSEDYDWGGVGFTVDYALTKRFSTSLTYRLTLRSSEVSSRSYSQNVIGIRLSYAFK